MPREDAPRAHEMAAASLLDSSGATGPSNPRGHLLDLNTMLRRSWTNTRAPDINTEAMEIILIARAVFCRRNPSSCPIQATEPHLVIHYDQVEISHTSAVAISYTWGRFGRRPVAIGHRSPDSGPGDPIYLELGVEWNTRDLQNCLVSLSEKHGGFWMDQLCKPEGKRNIDRTLRMIPTIYRSLDVIALMAGACCRCLQEWTRRVIDKSGSMTHDQINELYHEAIKASKCVNFAALDSWFDRLWTRQELMYSRRITVLRSSQTVAPCVTRQEEAGQLQGFTRLIYEEKVEAGDSARDAYQAVLLARVRYLQNAMNSMTAYCRYGNPDYTKQVNAAVMLSYFLRGKTIESPQRQVSSEDVYGRLGSFLYQLAMLGKSSRKATKSRDYVIAVWVDCPGYKPPDKRKEMTLPVLLEDAIVQLERNFGISPASYAPAGLFGDRRWGGLWRPTTYLPASSYIEEHVIDTRKIYGVLEDTHLVPIFKQSIPLVSLGQNSLSISSRAAPYSQIFGDSSTADVLTRLQPLVAQLSLHSLSRVVNAMIGESSPVRATESTSDDDKFVGCLLGPHVPDRPAGRCYHSDWSLPEIRHHDIVYRLVTSALGLPLDACIKAHLKIMLSLEHPPSIGLFKPSVSHALQRSLLSLDERVRTSHIHGHQYATLCTVRDTFETGCSLLETAFVKVGPPAVLEVVGIWVPMKYTPLDDVQVLAQTFGRDARLGGLHMDQDVEYRTVDELLGYVMHRVPQSLEAEMRSRDKGEDEQDGVGRRSVLFFAMASLLFLPLASLFFDALMRPQLQEMPADSWEICMVGPSFWKIAKAAS